MLACSVSLVRKEFASFLFTAVRRSVLIDRLEGKLIACRLSSLRDASFGKLSKIKSPLKNNRWQAVKSLPISSLEKRSASFHTSADNGSISSPHYSESLISNSKFSRRETDSWTGEFGLKSSISSHDRPNSASSLENITVALRPRTHLTHLLSLDLLQSAAHFIYPNVKLLVSGLALTRNEKNSICTFSNTFPSTANMPLVFLGKHVSFARLHPRLSIGSEYFLRQPIHPERLKFPLRQSESVEPLVDLFLHRVQFIREVPLLDDLSRYLLLPHSISALLFFDSTTHQSGRHSCQEWRTKENRNRFTLHDLSSMSQRENHIIQISALHDHRYHALRNELTEIYSFQAPHPSYFERSKQLPVSREKVTRTISPINRRSSTKSSRLRHRSVIGTSLSP